MSDITPFGSERSPSLHLRPIRRDEAQDFVRRVHRHNRAPVGDLFRVAIENEERLLVCVGIAGRPVARAYDDGWTVEVTRVASDGTRNATSMAYAALTRAAFALGYRRVITYTQHGESGSSLRAAGFKVIAQRPPRAGWDAPGRSRPQPYVVSQRTLWGTP